MMQNNLSKYIISHNHIYNSICLHSITYTVPKIFVLIIVNLLEIFGVISKSFFLNSRKSLAHSVKTGWDVCLACWELMNLPILSIMTFMEQFSVMIPAMFLLKAPKNAKVRFSIFPAHSHGLSLTYAH